MNTKGIELVSALQKWAPTVQDELQDIFLQNVSHELRTPVTLIHGCAELLHDGDVGTLAPEQQKLVSIILGRTDELRRLVESITALLAIQAHAIVKRSFLLAELAQNSVEAHRAAADRATLTLEVQFDPDLARLRVEPLRGPIAKQLLVAHPRAEPHNSP